MPYLSTYNGVFGKLPSHQMAVAIIVLIGKKIREINFGYRALPYILCAYKYGVLHMLKHIFPNTYQRIKSIHSPAKGGTGCYRFNYQPGS